jgi:hypothetical protein
MHKPKILHLDIETAPILAWVWSLWKPTIAIGQIEQDWHMLCWAAKWHGKKRVYKEALWHYRDRYERSKTDEVAILTALWQLLDEADIVVAHNGDRFDVAKINAKFFEYGMNPPSPFKTVDTLKVAKANFKFSANRLDYIAKLKRVGQKLKTDFDLWLDVMAGNKKQCKRMMDYNVQDVLLLEEIYTLLLPWITNHPNVGVYNDKEEVQCPNCGGTHLHYRGFAYTNAGKYQRFVCTDCGRWGKLPTNQLGIDKRRALGRNVPK